MLKRCIYLLAGQRDNSLISICTCLFLQWSSEGEQQLTFIFGDAAVEGVLEQEDKSCYDISAFKVTQ